MSIKNWPGGRISSIPPTPSGPYQDSTASGVWTLEQQAYWEAQNLWPTAGNVNPDLFIENLFQTWLYTGTSAAQTINNGIDLAGKGGMTWIKGRSAVTANLIFDTVRGYTNTDAPYLITNSTGAQTSSPNTMNATSTGFNITLAGGTSLNANGTTYASWTFREQPKFFDVVTWSGNNASTRAISHNLGSVPGCIIVKQINDARGWPVYHRMLNNGTNPQNYFIGLDETTIEDVDTGGQRWGATAPNSTTFTVGSQSNASGGTYVAYLFAHNAGGFGLTGTDNVISCGSYTGNGSATGPVVDLGYEPQWVLVKRATGGSGQWRIFDNMRGLNADGGGAVLFPNQADAEEAASSYVNKLNLTSTGFRILANNTDTNASSSIYIYIAIRRGPMKTPTNGTSVFSPNVATTQILTNTVLPSAGFPVDLMFFRKKDESYSTYWNSRLLPDSNLSADNTGAEITGYPYSFASMTAVQKITNDWFNGAAVPFAFWQFRRAPGFFDQVCYTGTGSVTARAHNLTVAPELIILKGRNQTAGVAVNWGVWSANLGTGNVFLNATNSYSTSFMNMSVTATTFTDSLVDQNWNQSGFTYVAYLFASVPGVSKVGSYTGTGTTQTINCGFTAGSRFVLIKRTDSTGGWYVWDSARGIVAGNDPYLLLNSTAAEVTNTDFVDTAATGFEISSTAPAAINANGGTFIFLAIA